MRLMITPDADEQIAAIDMWWMVHRPAAPALFAEELAASFDLLRRLPRAGRSFRSLAIPDLRRLLLRATRYHVYYAPRDEVLWVLAVWSACRGSAPRFRPLQ